MEKIKRQWLCRILTGALAGVAAHVLLGYVLGSFSLFGPARFTGLGSSGRCTKCLTKVLNLIQHYLVDWLQKGMLVEM